MWFSHRRVVFDVTQQLTVLVNCQHWFNNNTLRRGMYSHTNTELFTISALLRRSENCKQAPLSYAIIYGTSKVIYTRVYAALINLSPTDGRSCSAS